MAKAAKQRDTVNDRDVTKAVSGILARFENIESARGKFMNLARREREGMTAIYEGLAQKGISQKAAKTEIKIIRLIQRALGLMADLELEDRKWVQKMAKMQKDRRQLSLFAELPKPTKAEVKEAEKRVEAATDSGLAQAEAVGSA